jgi:hypothetical protein
MVNCSTLPTAPSPPQVGSVEALGEPFVDVDEHRARLVAAAGSRQWTSADRANGSAILVLTADTGYPHPWMFAALR